MALLIPGIPDEPSFDLTTALGAVGEPGSVYVLRFTWRDRTASWYIDLFESDGVTAIVLGKRLSPGWAPYAGLVIETLPDGLIYVRGTDDFERADLATNDLRAVFLSSAEIGAAAPAPAAPRYSIA